jgi:peroxiredoxin
MAQLRQRRAELDRWGAVVYDVLPMDLIRSSNFQKTRANGFTTLSDPAGRACAIYGVAKQLFVHHEWVNSPSVFVIDRRGVVTFAHVGTSFSDRPSADVVLREVANAAK